MTEGTLMSLTQGFCVMCLRLLRSRRMNRPCRHLLRECIHQDDDARHYERDREELAHVEDHSLLESNLRFLDEFDDEPHSEASDQEKSEEYPARKLVELLPVQPDKDKPQDEIGAGFVQLGRMLGFCLSPKVENESPWEAGDITVYL